MLSKKNEKRGMFQLNIGFTGTQALQWEVQNEATRSYTGFILEMRKLSSSLRDKLGRAMVFLCDTVVQSVLVGTPLADLFVPNVVRGNMFTKRFMEMMNLAYEPCKSRFPEGLTFFIVRAGNSMVDPHYDKNDDKRQGFDHHVTGFVGLDFTEDKGMRRQLEEVDLPAKLDVTYVAWTRKIIREVVDKINRVPIATEGVAGALRSILSSNSEDLQDVDLFEAKDVDVFGLFSKWKQRDEKLCCHTDEENGGGLIVQKEALTLFFQVSSFWSVVMRLFTKHRWLVPTCDVMTYILVTWNRANGQQWFYCVYYKLGNNKFLDGRFGTFQDAYCSCGHLAVIVFMEWAYMGHNREDQKWKSGTDRPHWQINGDLPFIPLNDNSMDGDMTQLDIERECVFDMINILKEGNGTYNCEIAMEAYERAKKTKGYGHIVAQWAVCGMGVFGLPFHCNVNFGTVDGSASDNTGPANFIRNHSEELEGGWTS